MHLLSIFYPKWVDIALNYPKCSFCCKTEINGLAYGEHDYEELMQQNLLLGTTKTRNYQNYNMELYSSIQAEKVYFNEIYYNYIYIYIYIYILEAWHILCS